jgi:hypothetical protein
MRSCEMVRTSAGKSPERSAGVTKKGGDKMMRSGWEGAGGSFTSELLLTVLVVILIIGIVGDAYNVYSYY